jgi:LmbE family N-acetylglucosaminyl deacetylase
MGYMVLTKEICMSDCLMIVAHADDESIFAGDFLIDSECTWDILCIVTPDHLSLFRIPMFLEKLPAYLGVKTSMLSYEDTRTNPIKGDIFKDLLRKITEKSWKKIVTHGPTGEYGHNHHIQVHKEVVSITKSLNIIEKLYVFTPYREYDKDNPGQYRKQEISKQKLALFAHTYDDETNLPDDHPREWIHGWNKTNGWKEKITKYTDLKGT